MRAYKFLDGRGHTLFTETPWTEADTRGAHGHGTWVEAEAVRPCYTGIHACRPGDLAYWLYDTLWEIELDGEITESRHKVVAARGRLVRCVDEYPVAVRELGKVCVFRTRDRAVAGLRAGGYGELADRFAACETVEVLAAFGPAVNERVEGGSDAATAALLAVDAADFSAKGEIIQEPPFMACVAAGHEAASRDGGDQNAYDASYARERAYESAWLAERLGLD